MRLTRLIAAVAVVLGAISVQTSASAADEVTIDHVQSENGTASLLLGVDQLPDGTTPDVDSVSVTIGGENVPATAQRVEGGQVERTTVIVLDASNSMSGEKLDAAIGAIDSFLAVAPEDVRIGLVTFAGSVQTRVAPTADHRVVVNELAGVKLKAGTKMYDAVSAGVALSGMDGARSLLVLSDGADTGSSIAIDDLSASAGDAGVVVDVVALAQSPSQQATLAELASATGGRVIPAEAKALDAVFAAQAAALAAQVLVTFEVPTGVGGGHTVEAAVSADGSTFTDSAFVSFPDPATTTADMPKVIKPSTPLVGQSGLLAGGLALAFGLAGVLAFAVGGAGRRSLSEERIGHYFAQGGGAASKDGRAARTKSQVSLRDTAVGLAGQVVNDDFEDRLSKRLAGAGSSLKPAEWLLLHGAIAIGSGFLGLVLRGGALMVVLFLIGVALPWWWLRRKHGKRQGAFNAQLAETLTLMSGGLSAGLSLPQAVDTVVREGQEPMAGELRRALVEQRLGVTIEDALEGVGDRMDSQDFNWVVMAVRIQREVGGNLAELLTTVSETLREREYLRRQVRVLSAEGRFSGYVLSALPPIMFVYMLFVRPDFVRPLYTTGTGFVMVGVAALLLVIGQFVMTKLTKIEV